MITIVCEPLIRKWINSHKNDPETGSPPPEAMVSVVCLAAILIPAGQIWFAWTCTPNVHWIAPILAGVPFGAGNGAVFIYASAYLVQCYDVSQLRNLERQRQLISLIPDICCLRTRRQRCSAKCHGCDSSPGRPVTLRSTWSELGGMSAGPVGSNLHTHTVYILSVRREDSRKEHAHPLNARRPRKGGQETTASRRQDSEKSRRRDQCRSGHGDWCCHRRADRYREGRAQ